MAFNFLNTLKNNLSFFQIIILLIIIIIPQLINVFLNKRKKKNRITLEQKQLQQHNQRIEKDIEILKNLNNFVETNAKILQTLEIFISKVEDYNKERQQEYLAIMQRRWND